MFYFHHQPLLKRNQAPYFPSPKCFWLEETLQWDTDSLLTVKISAPPTLMARVLVTSTVLAARCQGFAVSSGIVSHEYAKRWGRQVAKSWSRAEVVQHGALWRCKLLPLNLHVIFFFLYHGRCSVACKWSYRGNSANYCILAPIPLWFFSFLCFFFNLMTNPFADKAP